MFLELAKFASLLLCILCLGGLFHTAFLAPSATLDERILDSLKMLALASLVCWGSGLVFRFWEEKTGAAPHPSVAKTLPVRLFFWGAGAILVLFVVSWFLEYYYLPLRSALER